MYDSPTNQLNKPITILLQTQIEYMSLTVHVHVLSQTPIHIQVNDSFTIPELKSLIITRIQQITKQSENQIFYNGKSLDEYEQNKSLKQLQIYDKSIFYTSKAQSLWQQVIDFRDDPKQQKLKLPTSLSSNERKFVHAICDQLKLQHMSNGRQGERYILISKDLEKASSKPRWMKKETKIPKGMSEIIPGFLYLGSGLDAMDILELETRKIEYILNLTKEWPATKNLPEKIKFKRVEYFDDELQVLETHLESAISFIDTAKQNNSKILVHCIIGKSRSPAVVIAYLMYSKKMNLSEAYHYVKKSRSFIHPNDGFIKQLMEIEKKLFKVEKSSLEWNWKPKVEPRPVKGKKFNEEMRKKIDDYVSKILPEDVLMNYVQQSVEEFDKKKCGHFANFLRTKFKWNLEEIQTMGFDVEKLKKAAINHACAWYVSKVKNKA